MCDPNRNEDAGSRARFQLALCPRRLHVLRRSLLIELRLRERALQREPTRAQLDDLALRERLRTNSQVSICGVPSRGNYGTIPVSDLGTIHPSNALEHRST